MSIPYNDYLKWDSYVNDPERNNWESAFESHQKLKQPANRAIQFIRDLARLVLKVPIRAVFVTPVFLPKNWGERERCSINAKLAGYSFVQMLFVPVKYSIALAAILTSAISCKRTLQWCVGLKGRLKDYTDHLDGRASQLEALKEEGIKNAKTREDFDKYKDWVYEPDACQLRKYEPI
jgi:hypothetical protein